MVIAVGHRFVASGKEQEWEALWRRMTEIAAAQTGFISSSLLRSKEHQSKYTLISAWTEEQRWTDYFHLPEVQNMMQQAYEIFSGPPFQEWFVVQDEIRAPGESDR
jgi:heme-degrading monooxygenase HmoA